MRTRTKGMGERGQILDESGTVVRTRKTILEVARELRGSMTTAEKVLWESLRKKPHGFKFYRQAPIDRFVADFYCPKEGIIIELDGGIHDEPDTVEHDAMREVFLNRKQLRILRFRNEEVLTDLHRVVQAIINALDTAKNKT